MMKKGIKLLSNEKLIKANSLIVAVIICANLLASVLHKILNVNNSIVIIMLISLIVSFILNRFNINGFIKHGFLITVILLSFGITYLFYDNSYLNFYFVTFLCYGASALYVGSRKINYEYVFKYIVIIYLLGFWNFIGIDVKVIDSGSRMGLGYMLIIPILASLSNVFYFKKRTLLNILSLVYFSYFQLLIGSRGSMLTIGVFFVLLIYSNIEDKRRALFIAIIICISIVLVLKNSLEIMINIRNTLLTFNIESSFLNHFINTVQSNNILNGRELLYQTSWLRIESSFIFGNGIGDFTSVTSTYVHNVFLQLLDEGGVFLSIPIYIYLFIGIKNNIFSIQDKCSNKIYFIFLFSVSICKLMVSSVFWGEQIFWLMLANCVNNFKFKLGNKISK